MCRRKLLLKREIKGNASLFYELKLQYVCRFFYSYLRVTSEQYFFVYIRQTLFSLRINACARVCSYWRRYYLPAPVFIRPHTVSRHYNTAYPVRGNYAVTIEVYYIIVPISYDTRVRVGRAVVFSATRPETGWREGVCSGVSLYE